MTAVHQKLAVAIVLLSLVGVLWAASRASKQLMSERLRWFGWLTVAAIALQAVTGAVLAATGSRPADPTHLVFGPATLLALPLAMFAGRGRSARVDSYIFAAGWAVTFVLSLRDVGTGGLSS